jgi:hypothetical protein
MTEMAQTVADVPAETKRVEARPAGDVPSFSELVYAHYDWWRALRAERGTAALEKHYNAVKHEFEAANGRIVKSYWCSHVESAVVLTEQKPRMSVRGIRCGFYLEGDWAAHDWPDIAAELHHCDELAVKATSVLTGVRHRICMNLIMASAEHLMSLVDRRASGTPPEKDDAVVRRERRCLEKTEHYYTVAANGQAQIVYFAGMASVAVAVAAIAGVWIAFDYMAPLASLIAGAVGAVVSVIQRINAGQFELDYDVGRPYAFFLGGLRPLIGGSLALVISFAFTGGLLHLPVASGDPDAKRLALLVVAFVAGFSERWAQDALASTVSVPASKS